MTAQEMRDKADSCGTPDYDVGSGWMLLRIMTRASQNSRGRAIKADMTQEPIVILRAARRLQLLSEKGTVEIRITHDMWSDADYAAIDRANRLLQATVEGKLPQTMKEMKLSKEQVGAVLAPVMEKVGRLKAIRKDSSNSGSGGGTGNAR